MNFKSCCPFLHTPPLEHQLFFSMSSWDTERKVKSEAEIKHVLSDESNQSESSGPGWSKIDELTNDDPKVVLMGDSVLDNFIWLHDPKRHTRVQLEELLRKETDFKDYRCVNLAVDQMSTFDFEHRDPSDNSWYWYGESKKKVGFADAQDKQYYVSDDGFIHSIENLKLLRNVRVIVISIGGNDVYLNPRIQSELVKSLLPGQAYRRHEVARQFGVRLRKILNAVESAAPLARIVPVIVYHPHYDFSLLGMTSASCFGYLASTVQKWCLSRLVTPMAQQTLLLAQWKRLSVVDLSRTFDPKNEEHYGTGSKQRCVLASWSGAEPSVVSTGFISRLVIEAMKDKSGNATVHWGVTRGTEFVRAVVEQNERDYASRYVFGPQ